MRTPDGVIAPVATLLDTLVPDAATRDAAKLRLLALRGSPELDAAAAQLASATEDPWAARARPAFLYVMYALILWAIPMGLIAAVHPALAQAIARGMDAYLAGLPEPLYTLFGTGYLGYTVARTWGKVKGER